MRSETLSETGDAAERPRRGRPPRETRQARRRGEFTGAYIDPALKHWLQEQACANYRTLSQELEWRLAQSRAATEAQARASCEVPKF